MEALTYLRVSGKGQLDGDGFERQQQAIASFAQAAGLSIAQEFREQGVSGTTDLEERPALLALVERLAGNGVKTVVVERADRLARDLMVQEAILRQLGAVGARVLTADGVDLTDSSDPTRVLLRQILGAVGQWDKTVTVLKLKAARTRLRQRQGRCEGVKPYGSLAGEQATRATLLKLRQQGLSWSRLAAAANEQGLSSRSGRPWTAQSVRWILRGRQS